MSSPPWTHLIPSESGLQVTHLAPSERLPFYRQAAWIGGTELVDGIEEIIFDELLNSVSTLVQYPVDTKVEIGCIELKEVS